jgi:hypothetical protein
MRAVESLMMVLALAVVGVGLWAVHKWLPQSGLSMFRTASSQTNTVPGPNVAKKEPSAKRAVRHAHNLVLPAEVIEVDVPSPGFPFPTPVDLPAGTTRAQILTKYGKPTARISGVEDGHMFERYYFLHHNRSQITVATLENGVVAWAESTSNEHVVVGQPVRQ